MVRLFIIFMITWSISFSAIAGNFSCWANFKKSEDSPDIERVFLQCEKPKKFDGKKTSMKKILWKNGDECLGPVVLRYFTPELTAAEREVFCLQYDDETNQYKGFSVGERNANWHCKKPSRLCGFVNANKEKALTLVGVGAGAVTGTGVVTTAAGITAVAHSSGAVILTGSSGYIAGTLGSIGATSVGILSAPATIAATAAAVVTVGGAVYFCRDKDSEAASLTPGYQGK